MTDNEENFIEEFRRFLADQEVELVAVDVMNFAFKGPSIFLDIETVYEES